MIRVNVNKKLHGADGDIHLAFNTHIVTGDLVTLYGPTGSGKSSILRMIAGLLKPESGNISVDGHVLYDSETKVDIRPQHRNIGMVFQEYSLFPNMTVRQNLEYALHENEDHKIIEELLDVAELKNLQDRKPHLLSGGQRQRVALTRTLVRRPNVLLLDEPLSALDQEMRSKLQRYILLFHQQMKLTTILVTHDLPEALKMSNRMLVLENGKLSRDCAPEDLLDKG